MCPLVRFVSAANVVLAMRPRSISARLVARAAAVSSLALSAYLVLIGVRALLQPPSPLRSVKESKPKPALPASSEPDATALGQQILARNIFDSQTGVLDWEPERVQDPDSSDTPGEDAPEWVDCPADMRLLAAIVYQQDNRALVSVRAGEVSRVMEIGDEIAGAQLTAVEPAYAYFRLPSGSGCALALFLSGPKAPITLAPSGKGSFVAASDLGESIEDLGNGQYKLRRDLIDRARTKGAGSLVRGVKFQPRIRKGETQGMRVKKIKETSLLYRLGVRDGDLLLSVNGFKLTDADGMLKAYAALQDQTQITLALSRKGQPQKLHYMFE